MLDAIAGNATRPEEVCIEDRVEILIVGPTALGTNTGIEMEEVELRSALLDAALQARPVRE